MKKSLFFLVLALTSTFLLTLTFATNTLASEIKIYCDGAEITSDAAPFIENGSVLLPLKATFDGLGVRYQWDNINKKITATSGSKQIILTVNSKQITFLGDDLNSNFKKATWQKTITANTPPCLKDSRVFVPLRVIAEAFDFKMQ